MRRNSLLKTGTGEAMQQEFKDTPEILASPDPIRNESGTSTGIRVLIETSVVDAHNASQLVEQILSRADLQTCDTWTLDFQRVRFMDSAGATAIADLIRNSIGRTRIELTGFQIQIQKRWPKLFDLNSSSP